MNNPTDPSQQPIITPKFAWRVAIVVMILLLATLIIHQTGKYLSKSIVNAGNTTDTQIYRLVMGDNNLNLQANSIRFEKQRRNGVSNGVKLYLSWPEMLGYSERTSEKFNSVDQQSALIFIDIAIAPDQVDMSSRFDPIYRNFLEGAPMAGPDGLVAYKMSPQSSYSDEILYVEQVTKERPFVVKCLQNKTDQNTSSAACQRDINFANGLRFTYRFSESLISQWRLIEKKVSQFAKNSLE